MRLKYQVCSCRPLLGRIAPRLPGLRPGPNPTLFGRRRDRDGLAVRVARGRRDGRPRWISVPGVREFQGCRVMEEFTTYRWPGSRRWRGITEKFPQFVSTQVTVRDAATPAGTR